MKNLVEVDLSFVEHRKGSGSKIVEFGRGFRRRNIHLFPGDYLLRSAMGVRVMAPKEGAIYLLVPMAPEVSEVS